MNASPKGRMHLLLGLLATLAVIWVYAAADTYASTQELKEFVQSQFENANRLPEGFKFMELAVDAVVTRPFIFFGSPIGRGTIYTKATTKENEVVYWGIDFHCTREKTGWSIEDSGMYVHDTELVKRTSAALAKGRYAFVKGG